MWWERQQGEERTSGFAGRKRGTRGDIQRDSRKWITENRTKDNKKEKTVMQTGTEMQIKMKRLSWEVKLPTKVRTCGGDTRVFKSISSHTSEQIISAGGKDNVWCIRYPGVKKSPWDTHLSNEIWVKFPIKKKTVCKFTTASDDGGLYWIAEK